MIYERRLEKKLIGWSVSNNTFIFRTSEDFDEKLEFYCLTNDDKRPSRIRLYKFILPLPSTMKAKLEENKERQRQHRLQRLSQGFLVKDSATRNAIAQKMVDQGELDKLRKSVYDIIEAEDFSDFNMSLNGEQKNSLKTELAKSQQKVERNICYSFDSVLLAIDRMIIEFKLDWDLAELDDGDHYM